MAKNEMFDEAQKHMYTNGFLEKVNDDQLDEVLKIIDKHKSKTSSDIDAAWFYTYNRELWYSKTPEESEKIRQYIKQYGLNNWFIETDKSDYDIMSQNEFDWDGPRVFYFDPDNTKWNEIKRADKKMTTLKEPQAPYLFKIGIYTYKGGGHLSRGPNWEKYEEVLSKKPSLLQKIKSMLQ